MVADARKKNWPSIRLKGDEDMKEMVFIEAILQGIKVDLKNSDGYQPSAWAIDQIGTRMQLTGQGDGIYGRDGIVNLEKAFGAMPYETRPENRPTRVPKFKNDPSQKLGL